MLGARPWCTLSQREKVTGRVFDRQIGSTERGDRTADCRVRTGFAFDPHTCYATGDRKWSSGKKGEPPISSGLDSASAQASAAESRRRDNRLTRHLARPETGAIAATLAVFVFFSLASPHFLGERVLGTILLSSATLGILAVGVCMLMIAGQFDLSVGSVYGVASGIALTLLNMGVPAPAALVITLAAGLAIGALNGFLVTRLGIHSFIITLGALMLYRGVLLAMTGGFPIRLKEDHDFLRAFDFIWGPPPNGWIPGPFFWFIVLVVIFQILLRSHRFGNHIFAVGGNLGAALAVGINTKRTIISCFMLSSMLACFAGFIAVARFSSTDALRGTGMELEVILAVVVGGAALTGGFGSIVGAGLGVLMVMMVQQGLILIGVQVYWYRAGVGVLLVAAAVLNHQVRKRGSS